MFPFDRMRALVSEYPHVVGVTVSGEDRAAVKELVSEVGGTCAVRLTGGTACFEMLQLGVYGFHSIQPSFAPTLCSTMLAAYHRGEKNVAEELSDVVRQLCEIVHTPSYCYPRSIKPILNHLGFSMGIIRRPYMPPSDDLQREMRRRIDALHLERFEDLPRSR
jgi:dihydrodipicolinate synthase/N-acetylneuraminate lyase